MDDIHGQQPTIFDRRRAEQLVREQVLVQTFADMPAPSLKQKLAAAHYELSSSASPVAIVRALLHSKAQIEADAMRAAGRHHARFGS